MVQPRAEIGDAARQNRGPDDAKGVPTLVEELWRLVVAYFRQETIEPLKGLARFAAFGVAGSVCLGIGFTVLLVGGLRALQTETDAHFTGHWSWAPYGIAAVAGMLVMGIAVSRVGKGDKGSAKR